MSSVVISFATRQPVPIENPPRTSLQHVQIQRLSSGPKRRVWVTPPRQYEKYWQTVELPSVSD